MNSRIFSLFALTICLCACGDETSSMSLPTEVIYSSSDVEPSSEQHVSSSSEQKTSSSSEQHVLSSSGQKASSSSEQHVSSSSRQKASSSSEQHVSSSSEQKTSSSSEQHVLSSSGQKASSSSEQHVSSSSGQKASSSSEQHVSSSSGQKASSSSEQHVSSSSESILVTSIYDSVANTLTDLRDNQVYRTVTIGTQIWMAENLNHIYNKGSAKSYCFNDSIKYCNNYGRLYTKSAAMDSAAVYSNTSKGCGGANIDYCYLKKNTRGICPEKWHIPDSTEWRTLLSYVGGKANLMSSPPWDESCEVGKDVFYFSVLPGGNRSMYGNYSNNGDRGGQGFWFSTIHVRVVDFGCYLEDVLFHAVEGYYAYPVRCIKDSE